MAENEIIAGHHAKIYWLEEVTQNVTPSANSGWMKLDALSGFEPTFNPNLQEVEGCGSRRYLAKLDGEWAVGLKANFKPMGYNNFITWLKMAMGATTGTTDAGLPTFSVEEVTIRDSPAFFMANLYNGCKLRSLQLQWQYGQALQMSLDALCQYVQVSKTSGGSPLYLTTYTGGHQNITIGGRTSSTDQPYNFTNAARPKVDYGAGLADMPSLDAWSLRVENDLEAIPGGVAGYDSDIRPIPERIGEKGQKLSVDLTLNPKNLAEYEKIVTRAHALTKLRLVVNHIDGVHTSTTIDLTGGHWNAGDYSLRELVLMKQPLNATFNSATITNVP